LPYSGTLGQALSELDIKDVIAQPGRAVSRIFQGDRTWVDEADGVAGGSLKDFSGNPEIVALHELLRPVFRTNHMAATRVRRLAMERAAAPPPAPPAPHLEPHPSTQPPLSAEEYRAAQQADAKARSERLLRGTPFVAPEFIQPGNGRFANRKLA
jgi:hypothetical protein